MGKKRCCTDLLDVGTEEKRSRFSSRDSFTNKNLVSDSDSSRHDDSPDLKLNLTIKGRSESKIRREKFDEEHVSDSESVTSANSNAPTKFGFSGDGLVMLEEGDKEHSFVQNRFLQGLGFLGRYTSVVGIHRNSHSGFLRQARLETFQAYSEVTANRCGGNANVRYAWRGTSRDEVHGIICHGFGLCDRPETGISHQYGVGLYLYPEDSSINSALSSIMDKNGMRHVVFCRVIMGNMEQVPLGSEQFHPSSEEFDSGVDDLISPKRYIVWSTHTNTHIFPEYILSFKVQSEKLVSSLEKHKKRLPEMLTGVAQQKIEVPVRKPTSAWMPMPRLISVLSRLLSSSSMSLIKKHHSDFLEKRISREYLIKQVRQIAGDKLLIAAINSFQVKASTGLSATQPVLKQLDATVAALSEESTCTGDSDQLNIRH